MTIQTKFNIGDKVGNKTIKRIIVRYDSQFKDMCDIHYVLSDGFYKSEEDIVQEYEV